MSGVTLAIVGSRQYDNYEHFCFLVDKFIVHHRLTILKLISGDAPGIDQMTEDYAIDRGYAFEYYPADWDAHGKAAGFIRNQTIVDKCTNVLAISDGETSGTQDTITKALKARRLVRTAKIELTTKRYYSRRHRKAWADERKAKEAA